MSCIRERRVRQVEPRPAKTWEQWDREAARKALDQFADYDCRFGTDANETFCLVVEGPEADYHVHEDGRCDCPHYTQRLAGTPAKCKHYYIGLLWFDAFNETGGDWDLLEPLPDVVTQFKPVRRPASSVEEWSRTEQTPHAVRSGRVSAAQYEADWS